MVHNISQPASYATAGDTLRGGSVPIAGITSASWVRRVMMSLTNVEGVAEAGAHIMVKNRVRTGVPTLHRKATKI